MEKDVRKLLIDLFSLDELIIFVRDNYGDIEPSINFKGSVEQVAFDATGVLRRQGLLSTELFDHLAEARPHRAHEIEQVRRKMGSAPAEPSDSAGARSGAPNDTAATEAAASKKATGLHGEDGATQLQRGTIQIFVRNKGSKSTGRTATGFLVAPHLVMTASHVFDDADDQPVIFFRRDDQARVEVTHAVKRVVGDDRPDVDLALIEFPVDVDFTAFGFDPCPGVVVADGMPPAGSSETLRSLGFPRAFTYTDGEGEIRDYLHAAAGVWEVTSGRDTDVVHLGLERPFPDTGQWHGFSGAAVFWGDRFLGTVINFVENRLVVVRPQRLGRASPLASLLEGVFARDAPQVPDVPEGHRHDLALLLQGAATRRAVERWFKRPLTPSSTATPSVLAREAEEVWRELPLRKLLYDVRAPWEEFIKHGMSGVKAEKQMHELLSVLLPLHPGALDGRGKLAVELQDARRLKSAVAVRLDELGIEAAYAIQPSLGPGIADDALIAAFYTEVARRNEWTVAFAKRQMVEEHERYQTDVERHLFDGEPTRAVPRPFYLRAPDRPEVRNILEAIREELSGGVHLFEEGADGKVSIAWEWALRELRKLALGGFSRPEERQEVEAEREEVSPPPRPRLLRWLHVSDLHFGRPDSARDEVLGDLVKDAKERCAHLGPLDLLLVTGDIAWSGQPEQYREAKQWLKVLADATGTPMDRAFAVCGNHDVDRGATQVGMCAGLHRLIRQNPVGELRELPGDLLEGVWSKFDGFVTFCAGLGGPLITHNAPFWTVRIDTGLGPVCVAGLNTAIASMDDQDGPETLALGHKQVVHVTNADEVALLVTLMHHPCSWVADGAALDERLANRAHLAFHGHLHETAGGVLNQFGQERLWFGAGAGHSHTTAEYSYAIGELTPDGLTLYPRVWSKRRRRYVEYTMNFDLDNGASHTPAAKLPAVLKTWLDKQ